MSAHRGYDKIQSWDWGVAAKFAGTMPDKWEFIDAVLSLYDRAAAAGVPPTDEDEFKEWVVQTLLRNETERIRMDTLGKWGKLRDGTVYMKESDGPDNNNLKHAEVVSITSTDHHDPADEVIRRDSLANRMALVRQHVEPDVIAALAKYVDDGGSMLSVVRELGGTQQDYDRIRRRLIYVGRKHRKELEAT